MAGEDGISTGQGGRPPLLPGTEEEAGSEVTGTLHIPIDDRPMRTRVKVRRAAKPRSDAVSSQVLVSDLSPTGLGAAHAVGSKRKREFHAEDGRTPEEAAAAAAAAAVAAASQASSGFSGSFQLRPGSEPRTGLSAGMASAGAGTTTLHVP